MSLNIVQRRVLSEDIDEVFGEVLDWPKNQFFMYQQRQVLPDGYVDVKSVPVPWDYVLIKLKSDLVYHYEYRLTPIYRLIAEGFHKLIPVSVVQAAVGHYPLSRAIDNIIADV